MLQKCLLFLLSVFVVVVLYSFVNAEKNKDQQQNHQPVVKIINPKNNTAYAWNAPVQYKIRVSDVEDGESAFQEIPSNEVFLKVRYEADAAKAASELNQAEKNEPAGFTAIKLSNCLNCHAFTGKLIGPSFYDINKRYPNTNANVDMLSKRIREGSVGVWGNVKMPTHPEISPEETQEIVQWILKDAAEPNVNYYLGTEGYFTLKPPSGSDAKGAFVVTATYTDHGLKDKPKQNQSGHDVVIIQGK